MTHCCWLIQSFAGRSSQIGACAPEVVTRTVLARVERRKRSVRDLTRGVEASDEMNDGITELTFAWRS